MTSYLVWPRSLNKNMHKNDEINKTPRTYLERVPKRTFSSLVTYLKLGLKKLTKIQVMSGWINNEYYVLQIPKCKFL